MKIKTTPKIIWKKCTLDIVGPSNQTLDGNRYVLTFQDEHCKYTLALPNKAAGCRDSSQGFVEEIVLKFKILQAGLTDQGFSFMSEVSVNVCKLYKIKKIKLYRLPPTN